MLTITEDTKTLFTDEQFEAMSPKQIAMGDNLLFNIVIPLLPMFGGSCLLTNSIRFYPADFIRLQKAGYNPSKTSDHLYGGIDVVFDMAVAVQEFELTNPLTGEIVIGYGAYVDQILRQWSDQKLAEWNAQKEQAQIDAQAELDRLTKFETIIDTGTKTE